MSDDNTASPTAPPGFWLRAGAKFADFLVLTLLSGVLLLLCAVGHARGVSGSVAFWFLLAASALLPLLYFTHFTSAGRQTFGYRLAGVRAETNDGQNLSFARAFARTFIALLFLLVPYVFWIDYLPFLARKKRVLHDMATKANVVSIARPRPAALLLCTALLFVNYLPFMWGLQQISARSYFIPSGAMEKTLQVGDKLLVNTLIYKIREPQFGDIVVFKAPPASGSGGQDFIKRCIGVPGDVTEIKKNKLYRNGKLVREDYAYQATPPVAPMYGYDMKIVDGKVYSREYFEREIPTVWMKGRDIPLNQIRITHAKSEAVPPGKLLMLGDNRNNSNDSHAFGFVPRENLVGKAMFRFWPLSRMGGF
jgi:signal peptidase I